MLSTNSSPAMTTCPPRASTDGMKGLLILLVIFGHAGNFWTDAPAAIVTIKFFHVACFLLLPFIYPVRRFSWTFMRARLARYYVPFLWFTLAYGAVFYMTLYKGPLSGWLELLPPALLIANAPQIDSATGMQALWFLPALITTVLGVALLIGRWQVNAWALAGCAFALHAGIGLLDQSAKEALPFGLANVAYLFFLGCVLRLICRGERLPMLRKSWLAWAGIFLLSAAASYVTGAHIKFPVMYLPSIAAPAEMLIQDTLIIAAFMALLLNPYLCRSRTLQYLGQKSLAIYLIHLPFVFAAYLAAREFTSAEMSALSVVTVLGIFTFALAGALACIAVSEKFPLLQRVIFPRDWVACQFKSRRPGEGRDP